MDRAVQILIGLAFLLGFAWLTVWFIWRTLKKSEDPGRIAYKWVVSFGLIATLITIGVKLSDNFAGAFIGPIVAAAFGIVLGILWAPHIGALLASPITALYDGGDQAPEIRPFYSIARAKQKRGKYEEAIADVRQQLERFPEDYEGWMLLAELYGTNLKDNLSAQNCLEEILQHNGHAPRNVVYTLNRSADWYLEHAADRDSARGALEEIIRRFPGSEHAHTAAQRIAHLTTDKMLLDQRERPTIHLTRHDTHIGLEGKVADPRPPTEDPGDAAIRLLTHLQTFPEDVDAREQLATVYADDYRRLDLAAYQLEILIARPGVTPKETARWLNMLVDFHINLNQDPEGARAALRRIIELFPGSAVAGLAESRLAYLESEFRKNSKSQVLRLGSYEDNLGLKGQVPKRPD
ncbi:MAG: tetratricopeptide repeat protein [Limisphaerales bacterium]